MTKTFEDDLVLEEDKTFEESIKVQGDIRCKDEQKFNLTVKGHIDAYDIDAWNIDAWNIYAEDIYAGNIDAYDIDAWNIDAGNIYAEDIYAWNIDAGDIFFYAFCISYQSLKCQSIKGRRSNSLYKCLDQDIGYKEDSEFCGQKIEEEEARE